MNDLAARLDAMLNRNTIDGQVWRFNDEDEALIRETIAYLRLAPKHSGGHPRIQRGGVNAIAGQGPQRGIR